MIKCRWREKNRILFNIDGQVYPCCYLVNVDYKSNQINKSSDQYVMEEYNKSRDELNAFKNDMISINNHNWWDLLEESWKDSDVPVLRQCKKWCSIKEKEDKDV